MLLLPLTTCGDLTPTMFCSSVARSDCPTNREILLIVYDQFFGDGQELNAEISPCRYEAGNCK